MPSTNLFNVQCHVKLAQNRHLFMLLDIEHNVYKISKRNVVITVFYVVGLMDKESRSFKCNYDDKEYPIG